MLGNKLELIDYEVMFEVTSDRGSVCKMMRKYNTTKDASPITDGAVKPSPRAIVALLVASEGAKAVTRFG